MDHSKNNDNTQFIDSLGHSIVMRTLIMAQRVASYGYE